MITRAGVPTGCGWILAGTDGAGNRIRLHFGDAELAGSDLVIGRHPALCDRLLEDASVSRRHCRVGAVDDRLFVEDLNSLNGTLLDGEPIHRFKPVVVEVGSRLTLGRVELDLRRVDHGQA